MNLIIDDNGKKIFTDGDNKVYSLINMGEYVGHKQREWYDFVPDVWILMHYNEERADGKKLHIEALVDDSGNYIRFLISLDNKKRVVLLDNGMVYSDIIINSKDEFGLGDNFIALDDDIYSRNKVSLKEYLASDQGFYQDGQVYVGELSNNDFISEFLKKNNELNELLENSKTKKR